MNKVSFLVYILLVVAPIYTLGAAPLKLENSLSCKNIQDLQYNFLSSHIEHGPLTDLKAPISQNLTLQAISKMIEILDPEKIYFLEKDIKKIKNLSQELRNDIFDKNCNALHKIYNIYRKRVDERSMAITTYLKKNYLKWDLQSIYEQNRKTAAHPKTTQQANVLIRTYVKYHIATELNVYQDIYRLELYKKPSPSRVDSQQSRVDSQQLKDHLFYQTIMRQKSVASMKPNLTKLEAKQCKQQQQELGFQTCKSFDWYANYLRAFSKSLDPHSTYKSYNDTNPRFINLKSAFLSSTDEQGYIVIQDIKDSSFFKSQLQLQKGDKIIGVGNHPDNILNLSGLGEEDQYFLLSRAINAVFYLKILRDQTKTSTSSLKTKTSTSSLKTKASTSSLKKETSTSSLKKETSTSSLKKETHIIPISIVALPNESTQRASLSFVNKKVEDKNYKVAVIKIPSFYSTFNSSVSVAQDIMELILEAKIEGAQSMVLNVANNLGGDAWEVNKTLGLFLYNAKMLAENSSQDAYYHNHYDSFIDYEGPLVVLVNDASASASEILAGALQDYKRAVIVGGKNTYGKGSVQYVKNSQNGQLHVTTHFYFTPSGKVIQKNGILSDITLTNASGIYITEQNKNESLNNNITDFTDFKSEQETLVGSNAVVHWELVNDNTLEQLQTQSKNRITNNKDFRSIEQKIEEIKKDIEISLKPLSIAEILKQQERINKKVLMAQKEEVSQKEEDSQKNSHEEIASYLMKFGILRPNLQNKHAEMNALLNKATIQEASQIAADLAHIQSNH